MTQLALVIDLDVCVGCQACVTSCKQWNTAGPNGPMSDLDPYGANTLGTFFNRVQTYEVGQWPTTEVLHFPKSCLHCRDAPCVPVCPTGASYKRPEDGIVLVDSDKCIGCKYCAWACPYGAREFDEPRGVMEKCTLCVDRVYDEVLPEARRKPACVNACPTHARLFGDVDDPNSEVSRAIAERGGFALMPELGTRPANHYLPRRSLAAAGLAPGGGAQKASAGGAASGAAAADAGVDAAPANAYSGAEPRAQPTAPTAAWRAFFAALFGGQAPVAAGAKGGRAARAGVATQDAAGG